MTMAVVDLLKIIAVKDTDRKTFFSLVVDISLQVLHVDIKCTFIPQRSQGIGISQVIEIADIDLEVSYKILESPGQDPYLIIAVIFHIDIIVAVIDFNCRLSQLTKWSGNLAGKIHR